MNSPGQDPGTVAFSREQYDALESAVMESAHGRWFLAEYARRNRAADTRLLLDALCKLQNVAPAATKPSPDIKGLASAIKAARAEIAAARNDRLPDGGCLPADAGLYDRIAADARAAAKEIARRSMSLRVVAGGLRAATAREEHVEAVEANARSLETLSWSQEVLSARIARAMGLLSHIDQTLTGRSEETDDPTLARRQMPYFSRDEELFEPAPEAVESSVGPPAAAEKPRIVVIRRGKGDPPDIPLSG